jgi:hypothetical protein
MTNNALMDLQLIDIHSSVYTFCKVWFWDSLGKAIDRSQWETLPNGLADGQRLSQDVA